MIMPADRWRKGGLLGLAGTLLALACFTLGWLDTLENKSWDLRSRLWASSNKASEEIVLILLDQNSLDWAGEHLGLTWPWPREIYGAITDFCTRNKARAIGFDVIFSEPSGYGVADDDNFAKALEKSGSSTLAVVLGTGSGKTTAWPDPLRNKTLRLAGNLPPSPFTGVTLPVPELAGASTILSNVNLAPDTDGVYRKVPLFSRFDWVALPSLGLGAFLAANPSAQVKMENRRLDIGDSSVPLDNEGQAILNYRGPSGTHRTYAAAWILQNELAFRAGEAVPSEAGAAVRGKYVLFGFSAPGLFDIHATPVDSKCPGVEIHATILDNLLSGDFLGKAPAWAGFLWTGLVCLGCGLLMSFYTRAVPQLGISLSMLCLPVAAGFAARATGYWFPIALPLAGAIFTVSLSLALNYAVEGRRRRFIKQAFNQYLSPQVIGQILEDPDRLRLGGERRTLSIFFSDLEGFTSLSESMEPETLVAFLNQYLTAMTDIIHQAGGTIDKYEGDAIIAFWNAPLDTPDHALRAVQAALDCQRALTDLREEFKALTGSSVKMRIGINTGTAVVGNLGSNTRFDYTMIGDAVNLAARLESANKGFHTYTMVSEFTKTLAETGISYRRLGKIRVKGRETPVEVYEPFIVGTDADVRISAFETGLELYEQGAFDQALEIFQSLAESDPPSRVYSRECRACIDHPPENWDGIFALSQK